jgi:hypothetical protein
MIRSPFACVICVTCLPVLAQVGEHCRAKTAADIIGVFKRADGLYGRFAQSGGGAGNDTSRQLRQELEQYDEDHAMPCVRRASRLMAGHPDPVLMHALMALAFSHADSADETISYALGTLFAADPAAVERGLQAFPAGGRNIIAQSIEAGWINVKPGLSPALVKRRDGRLRKLLAFAQSKPRTGKPASR